MPVATPPTVEAGDSVLASQLDALIKAADDRLSALYTGKTWFAFPGAFTDGLPRPNVPTQQVPPCGEIYVLTPDSARVVLPAPGTAASFGTWPKQYWHEQHVALCAAMPLVGLDHTGYAWEVSGSFLADVYPFGGSASILERTVDGVTLPARLQGNYEPERFQRYALADVLIEDSSTSLAEWHHDKFGVVRFHNLGKHDVSVNLSATQSVTVPAYGIRTIRKLSRNGDYILTPERLYFPTAEPGDVPMWDGRLSDANPIAKVALLQSMFRPQAVLSTSGLFSSTVLDLREPLNSGSLASELAVEPGDVEVIRTDTGDLARIDRFTITFDGTVPPEPNAWNDIGLRLTEDAGTHTLEVAHDAALAPTPVGAWTYDIISRTTNLTGGIIVGTTASFAPFFANSTGAGSMFNDLFVWPTYTSTATAVQTVIVPDVTWVPTGGGTDTDYDGAWTSDGTSTTYYSFEAEWDATGTSFAGAWNLFTASVDSLTNADPAYVSNLEWRRQHVCCAITYTESVDFWHADDHATLDNACSVVPFTRSGGGSVTGITVPDGVIGLGSQTDGGWTEPRFKVHLFHTVGYDPQQTWESLGFSGSEDIIWTPLHPDLPGAGTISHFRTRDREGASGGAPWTWSYSDSAIYDVSAASVTSTCVGSGMRFWRCFYLGTKVPGGADAFPGATDAGPQPWIVRDHGWLADRVLEGSEVAASETWVELRTQLHDDTELGGAAGGIIRPQEQHVGMQIRMCAATLNQVSALIAGITHVRPCSFEDWCGGFSLDLVGGGSWTAYDNALFTTGIGIAPFGLAHNYGRGGTIDDDLDSIGVRRLTATCPEFQALATISCMEYIEYGSPGTYQAVAFARPASWSSIGDAIEYTTHEEIDVAMQRLGFRFTRAQFVYPVALHELIPDASLETLTDTTTSYVAGWHQRQWITRTTILPIYDGSSAPAYQIEQSTNIAALLPPQPLWGQVFTKANGGVMDVYRVGEVTGDVADGINSALWHQFAGGVNGLGYLGRSTYVSQGVRLLAAKDQPALNVMATPWRRLLFNWAADDSGPRSFIGTLDSDVTVSMPDDVERPRWITVQPGALVNIELLTGSAAPAYPSKNHQWELTILPDLPRTL